jgi:hypothetical protein
VLYRFQVLWRDGHEPAVPPFLVDGAQDHVAWEECTLALAREARESEARREPLRGTAAYLCAPSDEPWFQDVGRVERVLDRARRSTWGAPTYLATDGAWMSEPGASTHGEEILDLLLRERVDDVLQVEAMDPKLPMFATAHEVHRLTKIRSDMILVVHDICLRHDFLCSLHERIPHIHSDRFYS